MNVRRNNRITAILIALTLVFTSAVAVFAENGSPELGAISGGSAWAKTSKTGYATWTAADNAGWYNVYLNGKLVAGRVQSTNVKLPLKKNHHYTVSVEAVDKNGVAGPRVVIGKLCTYKRSAKVKAKSLGSRKIKVTWKRVRYIRGYRIIVYENGKYLKTVKAGKKATSKTIKKLKKGAKYKFVVYPICENVRLDGIRRSSKTVKCK